MMENICQHENIISTSKPAYKSTKRITSLSHSERDISREGFVSAAKNST